MKTQQANVSDKAQLCEPAREMEVQGQLYRLENSVANLDSRLQDLFSRLHPVLRDSHPTDPNKGCEVDTCLVPIAHSVRCRVDEVDTFLKSVNDVLDRLEI